MKINVECHVRKTKTPTRAARRVGDARSRRKAGCRSETRVMRLERDEERLEVRHGAIRHGDIGVIVGSGEGEKPGLLSVLLHNKTVLGQLLYT